MLTLVVTIKSYAQWNPIDPKTTNDDLNISGVQFGKFHVKHNIAPLMVAELGRVTGQHAL